MDKRILTLSGATVACALGIGFFMQQSTPPRAIDAPDAGVALVPGQDDKAWHALPAEPQPGAFKIENITLTSVQRSGEEQSPDQATETFASPSEEGCSVSVSAVAMPGAMVDLSASSPCQAGKRLTVHHHGMMFTVAFDPDGLWHQKVPALASSAVFIIEPEQGLAEVAAVTVPDLKDVTRVVLQWSGDSGFEIHAREDGAEYGAPGHVWNGSDPALGVGQMMRLGDDGLLAPRLAEVYSLPRRGDGLASVDISVETEITQINCGRQIDAQTLSLGHGGDRRKLRTQDLTLAMPDCDAEGDFLVLNNLLENLKIASN
ncbi:hypothetical protein [Phycobacter sp. K97]|uniref:hypothetical protein n=1 Tax=Phycobacter sedimenti TaxID=3133977 RepID=UPI00311EC7A2